MHLTADQTRNNQFQASAAVALCLRASTVVGSSHDSSGNVETAASGPTGLGSPLRRSSPSGYPLERTHSDRPHSLAFRDRLASAYRPWPCPAPAGSAEHQAGTPFWEIKTRHDEAVANIGLTRTEDAAADIAHEVRRETESIIQLLSGAVRR
ncbi:hypothetical protein VTH06DRAFT_2391 [Thermothelomyces fergusii]